MSVTELLRVGITVADLVASASFFRDVLGIETGPQTQQRDPAWNALLGLPAHTSARIADVHLGGHLDGHLGEHAIKLVAFDPPGAAYPNPRAANDPWFQHVALVAPDIDAVWQRLEKAGPETITQGAPVLLPPNTGAVTAFKFRDPQGHPLELISFPRGVGDPKWQQAPSESSSGILGYDHTAIAVADLDRALRFYTELLGFRVRGRSLNRGPEQDQLDGLTACEVDVVALQPARAATPHVELLHYQTPKTQSPATQVNANDVASVRQVHEVDDLEGLAGRLASASVTFVSPGVVTLKGGGKAAAVRDPDGHMIVLMAG